MPLEKETGMVLAPIRMKAEHPSMALPTSSRIHFSRTYGVSHEVAVNPLGLIHPQSMEMLISQSQAHVFRKELNIKPKSFKTYAREAREAHDDFIDLDQEVIPADMEVVEDM